MITKRARLLIRGGQLRVRCTDDRAMEHSRLALSALQAEDHAELARYRALRSSAERFAV